MPNGKRVNVKHIGSVKINDLITIHNVLHVPEFHFNLLSVKKLATQFFAHLTFTSSHCVL